MPFDVIDVPQQKKPAKGKKKAKAKAPPAAAPAEEHKKPPQPYDPIFFRKVDLEVGTTLLYKGRLHPDTKWTITKIMSDKGRGKGMKPIAKVEKLSDFVTLKNGAGETKEFTFSYASYSAIWQLARD